MDSKWAGRPIVKDGHSDELDVAAALHEFQHGMSREDAEEKTYQDYKKDQHLDAATHHLQGMRAAQANGDIQESAKHGAAYYEHLKILGLDPMEEIHPDIKSRLESEDKKPHYKFKRHVADGLL